MPNLKPETRKLAIISTAHMTERDNEILENNIHVMDNLLGYMGPTPYGHWFSSHIDTINWNEFELSSELFATLKLLFEAGFDRVELDRDCSPDDSFPIFDW